MADSAVNNNDSVGWPALIRVLGLWLFAWESRQSFVLAGRHGRI